jgi:hypothetical protein
MAWRRYPPMLLRVSVGWQRHDIDVMSVCMVGQAKREKGKGQAASGRDIPEFEAPRWLKVF